MLDKIKSAVENYVRILRISHKPDREEFLETLRVCGIGVGVAGTIGFIFYLASALLT